MDSCLLHICRMGDSIAHNYFYSTVFVVVVSIGLELSQKHVLLFATYHPVACFLFSGCCWLCNCVGDILGWVFLLTMSMPLRTLFSRIMEHAIKLKKTQIMLSWTWPWVNWSQMLSGVTRSDVVTLSCRCGPISDLKATENTSNHLFYV